MTTTFLHQKPVVEHLGLYLTIQDWQSLLRTSRPMFHAVRREKPLRVAMAASRLLLSSLSAIRLGLLDVVIYLHENGRGDPPYNQLDAVYAAANMGHLHILKWLLSRDLNLQIPVYALDIAAQRCHFSIVEWVVGNRKQRFARRAAYFAARGGHLALVQWLFSRAAREIAIEASDGFFPIDSAAENGHLEIVQWLHNHTAEVCTVGAVNSAASLGYFDVVRWFFENRPEENALNAFWKAAGSGHLEIVHWLYANRAECRTAHAINHMSMANPKVARWLANLLF